MQLQKLNKILNYKKKKTPIPVLLDIIHLNKRM